jgi:hypothetical protein
VDKIPLQHPSYLGGSIRQSGLEQMACLSRYIIAGRTAIERHSAGASDAAAAAIAALAAAATTDVDGGSGGRGGGRGRGRGRGGGPGGPGPPGPGGPGPGSSRGYTKRLVKHLQQLERAERGLQDAAALPQPLRELSEAVAVGQHRRAATAARELDGRSRQERGAGRRVDIPSPDESIRCWLADR